MLVLTRKSKEQIHIGDDVTITILKINGQSAKIGIEAPRDVRIVRGELRAYDRVERETPEPTLESKDVDSQVTRRHEGDALRRSENRLPSSESFNRLSDTQESRLTGQLPEVNSVIFFKRLRRARGRLIH